jgi:hypothetical protein
LRTYGEIRGVSFHKVGFSIYHLAIEYKLSVGDGSISVYVNSMAELKKEINNLVVCNGRQDEYEY